MLRVEHQALLAAPRLDQVGDDGEVTREARGIDVDAQSMAGFEDRIGRLEVGMMGDVVVYSNSSSSSSSHEKSEEEKPDDDDLYARAVFAPPEDIALVLRGGKVMVAGSRLEALTAGRGVDGGSAATKRCEKVSFGSTTDKTVCVADELPRVEDSEGTGSRGGAGRMSFAEFAREMEGYYPAILPGVPPREPGCDIIR